MFGAEITGEAAQSTERAYWAVSASDRVERLEAARVALKFLVEQDSSVQSGNITSIELKPDNVAREGDVRDLVLHTRDGREIGLSAKNRNRAMRNPRISPDYDFGAKWFGSENSRRYYKEIQTVWDYIQPFRRTVRWRDVPEKKENVYIPALAAFMKDTRQLFQNHPLTCARYMMSYMLGIADYYMIHKQNGDVVIQSFNMNNSLEWGRSFPMPTRLVELAMRPRNQTTAVMVLDAGWQLSFRVHNADKFVKPSLKFTVQIVGQPPELAQHQINYRDLN